ncbi:MULTISPECIES: siderophore-interacting protein [unclassified Mesorhizobium]|uniref:siderophore-interacting protein n=1 Tax=unclassified Mesorhizobium TaxID=325217 RepID=UPI000FD7EE82|nr:MULTISPECIES: siderophore-interacting protein [unclassified Mesorhizobium]TGQ33215.1 siderophore-interacting protein [Mesorhizobium sp. M00.F.Ca.ET.216.01.1.1]TIS56890.1 MAG: siderophore-interacting protein [Mesorhizobium sp.]TIS87996.1 MAG: siderophore-interacting protein [Mesorhizobium sp.]TJW15525.1 MAG: siderophore-interacting protein [Mesorhizobium sp.]
MDQLSAQTRIRDAAIKSVMDRLRAEHCEFEIDTGVADQWEFRTHYGSLSARFDDESVLIQVAAEDETCLAYMKMAVAGHFSEHFGTTKGIRWQGDGSDAGTPVFFREITVMSSMRISPHMQRVRFAGNDLGRFGRGGLHVRLLLPPHGRQPVWPTTGADGLLAWSSGEDALVVRVYTIRALDAASGWLDVDFVLHPGRETPAAAFAEKAFPGEVIGMIGPGGGGVPEAENLLLLGDETALPAIGRILEHLSPSTRAEALIEVDGPEDRVSLATGKNIDITWLYRHGREAGTAGLLPTVLRQRNRMALPGYVWAGCEFGDFREIRKIVRKEWGLPRDRHLVTAYWRRGAQGEDGADGGEE